ncbi:zinc finger protein 2 homolog isoform X1 [Drosophila novamexicana]|uniref:zinc finger protein 2 homolog isoform X1 n=1 Tax=Drosophila novamexicana TaxID=47314 RepID=UPI0011E5D757|nr:zinc finger protein 2 homolog isoform X1 [Drosophila novamexicana]
MTVAIAAILIEDLGNCCRVCLEQPHRAQMLDMNLIYDEDAQLTYYDCYEICTKDNLLDCGEHEPHKLCKHCGVELQWAYDFYKKVALANKHLKNMHSEAEKEEHSEQIDKDNKDGEEHVLAIEFDKHLVEDPHVIEDTLSDVELEEPAADQSASEPETMSTATNIAFRTANDVIPRQRFLGPFSCQFCKKPFRNHSHMLKHQLIHLSDRPHFKCNVCDRFYLTQQALKVHVDTQHKKSGSACTICGKVFAIAKGLEIHMRYHNGFFPFDCDQCDRKFAQRSHLTVHQQVQHGSARFLCQFGSCGKLFTSSSALRNHECTHTEMPFECNVCQQGFPARYKLRLHAQRKHNMQLTLEQLESMRKFHIMRSKRVLAKLKVPQQQGEQQEMQEELDGATNDS